MGADPRHIGAEGRGTHHFEGARPGQVDVEHFRDTARRLLELEPEIMRIRQGSHTAHLGVYPIGINAAKFEAELDSQRHAEEKERIWAAHPGRKIVLSVERLDYTKGILERFMAVERLLELQPEWIGKFTFLQIAAPSRARIEQYQHFTNQVHALAVVQADGDLGAADVDARFHGRAVR